MVPQSTSERRVEMAAGTCREPTLDMATVGLRILIVEDHRDSAESLQLMLSRRGHHVRVARDSMSALNIVPGFEPEIAFVDVGLSGIDGYELAARLRIDPVGQNCVLVALTGYGQPKTWGPVSRAYARYLTKPVDIAVIDDLIASVRSRDGWR